MIKTRLLGDTADGTHVFAELELRPGSLERTVTYTDHHTGPAPVELSISFVLIDAARKIRPHDKPTSIADKWWLSCGQVPSEDRIIVTPHTSRQLIDSVDELWRDWHLNTMRAGCVHQGPGAHLGDVCPEGYRYGSAWLAEELPADMLAAARRF